jgi:N utilization substance protein B
MIKKVHGRHGARWVALQGLYAWQMSKQPLVKIEEDLVSRFFESKELNAELQIEISFDKAYLHELLTNIDLMQSELDELTLPHLDRAVNEVHAIERAILWIAIYELKARPETPYKVIINEAILLAKQFGAQDSHKFINGVLDKAAKEIRARECSAA